MILFLRVFLFIISMTGYMVFLVRKFHIKMEFSPAIFCAWTSNLLFFAGLLNVMQEISIIIFGGGIILLVYSLKEKKTFSNHSLLIYSLYVFVLFYFVILLRDAHFWFYDNFSHWGTVVKVMLRNDRMPNFSDTIMEFQSYPLGSSLFIYYVCKIVGNAEGCYLWAQFVMIISFLFTLMSFVKEKKWWCATVVFACSAFFLARNTDILYLCVDNLLPAAGVAAFAVIYFYRQEPRKMILFSFGILATCINIKNSGFFFFAVCVLFIIAYEWDYIKSHKIEFFTKIIAFPLLVLYLWERHIALVYTSAATSRHSMSLEYFSETASEKTIADITGIIRVMIQQFCSFKSNSFRTLCLAIVIFAAIEILSKFGSLTHYLKRVCAVFGIIITYHFGLFIMYIVSMPTAEEALRLAGYDRYEMSEVLFIYGILTVFLLDVLSDVKVKTLHNKVMNLASYVLLFIVYFAPIIVAGDYSVLYTKQDYKNMDRYILDHLISEYNLPEKKSYLIYSSDRELGYLCRVGIYELFTTNIHPISSLDNVETSNLLEQYEYLIVLNNGLQIREYLLSLGYDIPQNDSFVVYLQ